jgi:mRNA interferase MazF
MRDACRRTSTTYPKSAVIPPAVLAVSAPDFRVTIDPTEKNGLRIRSQVMADKAVTVRRERIGRQVGHLDDKDISRLNIALAFVMGLAD